MRKMNLTRHGLMLTISYLLIAMFSISCGKKDGLKLNDSETSTKSKLKSAIANSAQIIIDDMTLPCDACLHGTDGLSWGGQCAGNPGYSGTTVPAKNNQGLWWGAMTAWGQAYIDCGGSPAPNTRVQFRNIMTKFLLNDGQWYIMQAGSINGAAYVENFANNASKAADIRDESNNGGGISVTVGIGAYAGYNFHYYPSARAAVDHNTIVGIFTSVEARLILNDPNGPDDRAQSRTSNSMGADWWINMTSGWLPDWSANAGINGGRNKWITSDWQSYSMCTLSPAQINANPPIVGGASAPTVSTTTPTSISQTMASSGGNITADGGAIVTARGVCWSTSSNPTTSNSKTTDGTGTGTFTSSITDLTASTTYHVRAYATNSVSTSYGSDQQFTTTGGAYTTIPAKIEAEAYISMNGIATETTTDTSAGLNVGWIDVSDYMNYNIHVNSAGTFTVDLRVASQSGGGSLQLKSGSTVLKTVTVPSTGGWQTWTTVNSGNISLGAGDQVIQVYAAAGGWNFNWLQINAGGGVSAPTVSTTTPSSITQTTASSGGNITADGGASVTARGVCWSTFSNPTTSNSKTTNGISTGTFTSSITGLTASTTYHVRAYATNSVGTSYGSDQQFTTSSGGGALSKTGWTATATNNNGSAGLVIDGNNSTEYLTNGWSWSADNYTIDMKSNQTFTKIIRKVDSGWYPRGWTIYVSTDGANWGTAIASGTCTNGNDITSTFSSKTARYIKVVLTANQGNYWGEFEATVYQ